MKKLRKEEVIAYWKERRERRARILEERRNGAFAQKMKPVYQFMNRFSLIFHALLACLINFAIEAISRHSLDSGMELYDTDTTRLPLQCIYDIYDIYGGLPVQAKGVHKNHYRCTLDDSWNL